MLPERLKLARKALKCETQKDFAELVKFPLSRVQDIERGKVKELKSAELEFLQEKFFINSWWLLTGKGKMLLNDTQDKNSQINIKNVDNKNGNFAVNSSGVGDTKNYNSEVLNLDDDILEIAKLLQEYASSKMKQDLRTKLLKIKQLYDE